MAFRYFHVEIHLIVLSYPNQRDFRSSQPQHGWKRRHLVLGIYPRAFEWKESPTSYSLTRAIATNRKEPAQIF